jgi:hypothetical protein
MVLDHLISVAKRIHAQLIIMERLPSETITALGARLSLATLVYSVFTSLFFLAGVVLLVYSFWLKFSAGLKNPLTEGA